MGDRLTEAWRQVQAHGTVFDTCTTAGAGTCAFPDVPLGDVAVRRRALNHIKQWS